MGNLEHSYGIASIAAAFTFMFAAKGSKPHEFTTLLVGVLMIGLAAIAAATFSDFLVIAQVLDLKKALGAHELENASRINNLWVLIFPAVAGAMGVNLVTSWIQSSRPPREDRADAFETTLLKHAEERSQQQPSDSPACAYVEMLNAKRRRLQNRRAMLVRKR